MLVEEVDISTNLPASDEAFEMSKPEETQSLSGSLTPSGASKISSFAGIVLMACLFGRNLIHLHRPDADGRDHDLNGEFWRRHRNMDNILLNISLSMPSHLKLPLGLSDPNIVFTNMNIHTSAICLHQAAIYKASKFQLPASVNTESKKRCLSAANEIATIMRMVSHLDLSTVYVILQMNPFISFCLYVAARVYVQYLKSRPDDSITKDSLTYLLSAMNALKKKNPLTESFLVQLDVDLEALGILRSIPRTRCDTKTDTLRSSDTSKIRSASYQQECHYMARPTDRAEDINSAAGTSDFADNAVNSNLNQADWTIIPERHAQQSMTGLISNQSSYTTGALHDSGYTNHAKDSSTLTTDTSPTSNNSLPNRPSSNTPNPSETANLQRCQTISEAATFETSPIPSQNARRRSEHSQMMSSSLSLQPHYPASPTARLHSGIYSMVEAPGAWEIAGQQSNGLTDVSEGVLRHIMRMGPIDPMDVWDGR